MVILFSLDLSLIAKEKKKIKLNNFKKFVFRCFFLVGTRPLSFGSGSMHSTDNEIQFKIDDKIGCTLKSSWKMYLSEGTNQIYIRMCVYTVQCTVKAVKS